MKVHIYQLLHVASMVLLIAYLFSAFANPDPKNKRMSMMTTGIFATLMLIGGFGLLATLKLGFPIWIVIKLLCWLGLVSISGLAFRMPKRVPMLRWVAITLTLVAIFTVYFRPGSGGSYE